MPAMPKDRLIAALGAQLRAERETRDEIVRAEAWLRGLPPALPARPKLRAA